MYKRLSPSTSQNHRFCKIRHLSYGLCIYSSEVHVLPYLVFQRFCVCVCMYVCMYGLCIYSSEVHVLPYLVFQRFCVCTYVCVVMLICVSQRFCMYICIYVCFCKYPSEVYVLPYLVFQRFCMYVCMYTYIFRTVRNPCTAISCLSAFLCVCVCMYVRALYIPE